MRCEVTTLRNGNILEFKIQYYTFKINYSTCIVELLKHSGCVKCAIKRTLCCHCQITVNDGRPCCQSFTVILQRIILQCMEILLSPFFSLRSLVCLPFFFLLLISHVPQHEQLFLNASRR